MQCGGETERDFFIEMFLSENFSAFLSTKTVFSHPLFPYSYCYRLVKCIVAKKSLETFFNHFNSVCYLLDKVKLHWFLRKHAKQGLSQECVNILNLISSSLLKNRDSFS